jgi:hypothetical protein
MSIMPRTMGAGELATRVADRPGRGDWLVLLTPEHDVGEAAGAVAREIEIMADLAVRRVESPTNAAELAERIVEPGALVVSGLEHLPQDEWRHLDLLRSRLQRDQPVILVLTMPAMERLTRGAPNLASWLGGSVWRWDSHADTLSDDEREERLRALREWSGKSDADVVDLAKARALPRDPHYAEWLVLLGRGELLER